MRIKKIKEVYKIYDNSFGYMQRIRALLEILDPYQANYPSNFLLTIALRDLKSAEQKISKCSEILLQIIHEIAISVSNNANFFAASILENKKRDEI